MRKGAVQPTDFVVMEEEESIIAYFRLLAERRWTIVTVTLLVFTVVAIGTFSADRVYRATGLIEILKVNPTSSPVREVFNLESVSIAYLETQYKILRSFTLSRRVISQLQLSKYEEFGEGSSIRGLVGTEKGEVDGNDVPIAINPVGNDEIPSDRFMAEYERRLHISPVRRSNLVEISFDSVDPALASQVVNVLASNYIEMHLEARYQATQIATEWLSRQLLEVKMKLEDSEEELQKYAAGNGLLFLERSGGGVENLVDERLRQLQKQLTDAQAVRYEKQALHELAQSGSYGSLPGVYNSSLMQALIVDIADLRREHAKLLSIYTEEAPKVQEVKMQIDELNDVLKSERERGAEKIARDYLAAKKQEELLAGAYQRQQNFSRVVAEKSVQYNILKREVVTSQELYVGLLQRLKEARVSAGLKASNVRLVDPAKPPEKPIRPRVIVNLGLGMISGLIFGIAFAYMQDLLDNTIKTGVEGEQLLHLPALATIPLKLQSNGHESHDPQALDEEASLKQLGQGASERASTKTNGLFLLDETNSVIAEVFRGLRTSVLLSTPDRAPRSLMMTSAEPEEGKTTVSVNLAASLAQLGRRVLLIDGDLRRPSIHSVFKKPQGVGLVTYLAGQHEWRKGVQSTQYSNLEILVCGPVPPNPAELLFSERMRLLIQEAMEDYDFVIVDSPPVTRVADGLVLAALVDGVIIIIRAGRTPKTEIKKAYAQLESVDANILGLVINKAEHEQSTYYEYSYSSLASPSVNDEETTEV